MDRRSFIRSSCFGCAGVLAGTGLLTLAGCSTLPLVKADGKDGSVRVPRASFKEGNKVILRAQALPFDVLVMALPDGGYRSLYLRCTHRDQPLTATDSGLHCPSHGSHFSMDGAVQEGPADQPLHQFRTTTDGNDIIVDLKH